MSNPFLKWDSASRREFMLRTAKTTLGVSVLGSNAEKLMAAAEAAPAGKGGKAKSVIYLYMAGGMSHVDTWDPKTGDTKGAKDPISTNGNMQLGGYMTNMAKVANKITVVRSMTSKTGVHEAGTYVMKTGYEPRGTIVHPSIGSWAQYHLGKVKKTLPSSVTIGGGGGPGAGFFPPSMAPVPIGDPDRGLQNIKTAVSDDSFNKRIALMNEFDGAFREKFKSSEVKAYTDFYDETLKLLKSEDLQAFDLSKEDAATKEMYGPGQLGRGCLLARRLVQNGVRFVEVVSGGWDMHNYIDDAMTKTGGAMDKAFAALITDLARTGLLDSTMVVMGSEFGRTPRINENSGRDHFPKAYSTIFAGGGVKGGYVYGSTNSEGSEVADKPVTVQDFVATIGAAMGLPVEKVVFSPSGRPFTVGDKGSVVGDIFA
jgi:Protein of unknown function (DUF1501)